MATTPTTSPAVERIVEVIKGRFGKHVTLDDEGLLELGEKLAFITRSKDRATLETQAIAMFIVSSYVPSQMVTLHQLVFVHETKVVLEGSRIQKSGPGSGPDHHRIFENFKWVVDETIIGIIERGTQII